MKTGTLNLLDTCGIAFVVVRVDDLLNLLRFDLYPQSRQSQPLLLGVILFLAFAYRIRDERLLRSSLSYARWMPSPGAVASICVVMMTIMTTTKVAYQEARRSSPNACAFSVEDRSLVDVASADEARLLSGIRIRIELQAA